MPGVYLDGFATAPIAPEARAALIAALDMPANPSSPHLLGERAADIIDRAQRDVAGLVGCGAAELTFTSGATEANNIALVGGARAALRTTGRRRVVVSAVEHRSVLEPAGFLSGLGFEVVIAPVDAGGRLDLRELGRLVDDSCWLVSVMAVNNETGVVQPVAEVAALARDSGALVHTDVAQALGKISVNLEDWDVDYASLSGHKVYGPVGIGALYVAAGAPAPEPLQLGGGQQAGRRPGTEPVALIAGFGAAALVAKQRLDEDAAAAGRRTKLFLDEITRRQVRWRRTSGDTATVPGALSLRIDGCDGEDIATRLQNSVFISTGSACSSGQMTTSHVLSAMGLDHEQSSSVVRMMLGRYLTDDDVFRAAELFSAAVIST
ncbi:cysteine desulfurase family protein [Sphingomonas faeni]